MSGRFVNASEVIRPATVTHAVRAGNHLHVGGVIGADGTSPRLVEGGPEAQTRQALHNLQSVLAAANASLSDVVSVHLYLRDMTDFPVVDRVFGEVFANHRPARATLGVNQLALDAAVEITCIAYVSEPSDGGQSASGPMVRPHHAEPPQTA